MPKSENIRFLHFASSLHSDTFQKVKAKSTTTAVIATKPKKTKVAKKKGPNSGFYIKFKEKWIDPLPNPSKMEMMKKKLTKKAYNKYKNEHIEWFKGPKVGQQSIILTKKWIRLDLGQDTNERIRRDAMQKRWPTKIKGELRMDEHTILKITVLNPLPKNMRESGSGFDGDAGHLIAKSLGGTVAFDNIIPQNPLVNEQQGFGWRDFEKTTLQIVKASKKEQYMYIVKPIYGDLKDYTKLWML